MCLIKKEEIFYEKKSNVLKEQKTRVQYMKSSDPQYKGVDRRSGRERRSGKDRRKLKDPHYKGPERRRGRDRRSGKERRKSK